MDQRFNEALRERKPKTLAAAFAEAEKKSGGLKFDTGKPPIELLDPEWLDGVAQVLAFGAKKYAAHNWRKGIQVTRLLGGIFRHGFAILRGEDIDPESGLPHVHHLACGAMFLSWMMQHRKEMDDRWKPA
jgi:hypothetical protein